MKDNEVGILVIVVMAMSGFIGILMGRFSDESEARIQREAVKRVFAKWVPDEDGDCEFVWNEKGKP